MGYPNGPAGVRWQLDVLVLLRRLLEHFTSR